MKRSDLVDLYTDFLTSSPNVVSAGIVSKVLNDEYSHDSITRMLAQSEIGQKTYWTCIKKTIRQVECDTGLISIDDYICYKSYSTENQLVSYHYDHTSGRTAKGINILSFTYVNQKMSPKVKLPVAYELIRKDKQVKKMIKDKRKGKFVEKTTRKASIGKNELLRNRLQVSTHQNNVRFAYVAFDTWFASSQNMKFIVQDIKKHFVGAIKNNRLITFDIDKEDRQKQWVQVSQAEIEPNRCYKIQLKKVPFPLILIKKV